MKSIKKDARSYSSGTLSKINQWEDILNGYHFRVGILIGMALQIHFYADFLTYQAYFSHGRAGITILLLVNILLMVGLGRIPMRKYRKRILRLALVFISAGAMGWTSLPLALSFPDQAQPQYGNGDFALPIGLNSFWHSLQPWIVSCHELPTNGYSLTDGFLWTLLLLLAASLSLYFEERNDFFRQVKALKKELSLP